MTLTKIYPVENNQVIIHLPADFRDRKELLITVNNVEDSKITKLNALKKAANDPLFLADIAEVNNDFSVAEYENL